MVEKTLVFIKPDGVERGLVGQIVSRFETKGLQVREMRMMTLSADQSKTHYAEHADKPFYPSLEAFVTRGPIVLMVIEGRRAIETVRLMVGATDAAEAAPGTIRGDYGIEKSENLIHASDSVESAEREIRHFFG